MLDLNKAALLLTQIQIIEKQIEHLQYEAKNGSSSVSYAESCNESAERLILEMRKISLE